MVEMGNPKACLTVVYLTHNSVRVFEQIVRRRGSAELLGVQRTSIWSTWTERCERAAGWKREIEQAKIGSEDAEERMKRRKPKEYVSNVLGKPRRRPRPRRSRHPRH